jgi:DNA-binding SARP family transcriptional activator/tetratricopeptide (TPR) repeat protein
MWFALLGPLLVDDGHGPVELRGRLQRVLLAALVLRAGTPVAAAELADVVWDGQPEPRADNTLRSHVQRLRGALGPRAGARLVTRPDGYQLNAAAGETDVLLFRRLSRDGGAAAREGDWSRAHKLLTEAVGLWRGELLDGVDSERLRQAEGPELDGLRVQAEEWKIEAALCLGQDAEMVPVLQSLAARYPLRERFHAQLMLALYRDGRQAEALAAYQQARDVLVAELGVEPGTELRELQQRILSGDRHLARPGPARHAKGEQLGTPRDLPPAVPGFTGRAAELEALKWIVDRAGGAPGTVVISAIGGTAGVGKTALALYFAHLVAGRFSDGQLYVNLRGFDPAGPPATPAEVIRALLGALGVPAESIPSSPDDQARKYRSLMAGRQMLLVLDNARDEQQVRPLLPASPASLVLVTSRNQLTGLAASHGARMLNLDVLRHDEAVQLLTARVGDNRADAEPEVIRQEAISQIANLCACLPLALAVTAARAAARPGFPLATLATELTDAAGRLDALDAGDPAASVRAVFSWSYRQLDPDVQRMFRLLGLHPGPDISTAAAASLAATGTSEAGRLLAELTRACLIAEHVPGRFAFHDLLRAYASGLAREYDSEQDRGKATRRVLDHYLHTAAHAYDLIMPSREPLDLPSPSTGTCPEQFDGRHQAMTWYRAEHHVLIAVITLAGATRADHHAWQLAKAITEPLRRQGYARERVAVLDTAVDAAARTGDPLAQAMSHRALGIACIDAGGYAQSREHLLACLPLYRQLRDRTGEDWARRARMGEGWAQQNLASLAEEEGRFADAVSHGREALRLFREIGHKVGEAQTLGCLAEYYTGLCDYERARDWGEQSLALLAGLDFSYEWECEVWDTLGYIELQLGHPAEAAARLEHALGLSRDHGFREGEAKILDHLGDAHRAAGKPGQARKAYRDALAIYDAIQHHNASKTRSKLASMDT